MYRLFLQRSILSLLLAVASVAGCERNTGLPISVVVVNAPRQLDDDTEDKSKIEESIRDWVEESPDMRWVTEPTAHAWILKIRVGEVLDSLSEDGLDMREVLVQLGNEQGTSYSMLGLGESPEQLAVSVLNGFIDAWMLIREVRQAEAAGEQAVIKLIAHPDPRVRAAVLDKIAEKGIRAAVPNLCQRLNSEPNEELRLRVIGVLAELKDPRAVEPLTALTRYKSPLLLVQVLHALGSIGGKEAEGFLVTMATGHVIEGVRSTATNILREMGGVDEQAKEGNLDIKAKP